MYFFPLCEEFKRPIKIKAKTSHKVHFDTYRLLNRHQSPGTICFTEFFLWRKVHESIMRDFIAITLKIEIF